MISAHVRSVDATAEVTSASVDNLKFVRDGRADLALTLAPTLDDAYRGAGAFARTARVPANAIASLFVQYTHVVTFDGSRIARVADLRGKTVAVGGQGSGTEDMALRILRAAGLDPARDIRRQGLGVAAAAEALKDGKIDAFFWSSGIPAGPILDVANTPGRRMRLIPNDDALPALQGMHGSGLYRRAVIPARTYPGVPGDVPTTGTTTLLVVDERMSDALAYEITRALFDYRADLEAIHPAARELRPETASTGSPVPFHPGAVRFYTERGVWTA